MAISVTPVLPVLPAQEVAAVGPELAFRPGTTIDATVLKVLSADLVRIAIASLSVDVKTEIPLQQGQALKLAVSQTGNGIRLTNVGGNAIAGGATHDLVTLSPEAQVDLPAAGTPAAPKAVLTPLEKATITIAAQAAAAEQDSQAPLFANLTSVVNSPALPPKLLQAVRQVLAQQTGLDPDLSGPDIKAAFEKSGLFLEASLAAGAAPAGGTVPDLKAALLVLRQTLQSVLGGQSAEAAPLPKGEAAPALAPSAAQDLDLQEILLPQARVPAAEDIGEAVTVLRAGLASALKDAAQATATPKLLPEAAADPAQIAKGVPAGVRTAQGEEAHTNTPPPPFRGAPPSAQPVASPSVLPQRRWRRPPIICSPTRKPPSRATRCCRSPHFRTASMRCRNRPIKAIRPHRAGISRSLRHAAGHGDGAVRNFPRRQRQRGGGRQEGLARALHARC